MDFMQIYTLSENNIYIADISEDNYRVRVYDNTGKELYNISKNYRKIKMTKGELAKLNKSISVSNGDEINENKSEVHYRKAIHGLWEDKYERLWVLNTREHSDENKDLYFDIFEDGVFLNTIKFDIMKGEIDFEMNLKIRFYGDHLYLIDTSGDDIAVRKFEYT
ncbi:MAG: hypothetical protein GQ534_10885 [Candidatus Delongbacteria bacterium]|nr:hypothetical protein [Candidatus Delongbacteria bacterium]